MSTVLSLHYLPNIYWMRHFITDDCVIDVFEHFTKQTFRNRAVILGPNGPAALTIPVQKTAHKMAMHALQSDPSVKWQRQHWESLKTAYGSSPFFIHYADGFEAIYQGKFETVMEFEISMLKLILKYLKIQKEIVLSESYLSTGKFNDLRNTISPKQQVDTEFKSYLQVFAEKFPFIPNLSIVDALFNLGPSAREVIL